MNIKKLVLGLTTAACFCSSAFATPINFSVDSVLFTPGSGYGTGSEDLLDVSFTAIKGNVHSNLDMDGTKVWNFKIGSVALNEVCINGGGCPKPSGNNTGPAGDETDNLNVGVTMHFKSPLGDDVAVTLNGFAQTGLVNDTAWDYKLTFGSKDISFGNGGLFTIDFTDQTFASDLIFSTNTSLDLFATVTLKQAPIVPVPPTNVPEPASLALMGLGLAGLAFGSKRRKA